MGQTYTGLSALGNTVPLALRHMLAGLDEWKSIICGEPQSGKPFRSVCGGGGEGTMTNTTLHSSSIHLCPQKRKHGVRESEKRGRRERDEDKERGKCVARRKSASALCSELRQPHLFHSLLWGGMEKAEGGPQFAHKNPFEKGQQLANQARRKKNIS